MDVGYYGSDRTDRILRERVQARWTEAYAPVRHLDPVLVVTALLLAGLGMVMIYSATSFRLELQGIPADFYVRKQAIALGVGVAAMVFMAVFDYRWTRAYSPLLYGAAILLLVAVLTPIGDSVNGAQRWINLGGFNLQPSELAKVAVIVVVAALLHEQEGEPRPTTLLAALGLVAMPMGLVFLEPDLGTSIVFVWLTFVLFMVGGVRLRWLAALTAAGVGAIAGVLRFGIVELEGYQLDRLTGFLNAGDAEIAQTTAFHTQQSLIAIGSGQFAGKGFLEGTQNTLSYVPENHTDFIFTIVGEEFGFLGAIFVLGLYAVLLWRGLRIAMMAKDLYGTLLASAVVGLLALQVFVNVGMTVGIMPVTGIPLPFLSYGGTSLIMWCGLVGLLLNVHMRRFN